MNSSPDVPDWALDQRGPMFWLPPNGFGNGIMAVAWAELAAERSPHRLWVNSLRYRNAEDILMDLLATLHGRRPPGEGVLDKA